MSTLWRRVNINYNLAKFFCTHQVNLTLKGRNVFNNFYITTILGHELRIWNNWLYFWNKFVNILFFHLHGECRTERSQMHATPWSYCIDVACNWEKGIIMDSTVVLWKRDCLSTPHAVASISCWGIKLTGKSAHSWNVGPPPVWTQGKLHRPWALFRETMVQLMW